MSKTYPTPDSSAVPGRFATPPVINPVTEGRFAMMFDKLSTLPACGLHASNPCCFSGAFATHFGEAEPASIKVARHHSIATHR